jgi:hypothetical protein
LSKKFIYSSRKPEGEASSAGEQLASNTVYRLEWSEGSLNGSLHFLRSFQEFYGSGKLRTRSVLKVTVR